MQSWATWQNKHDLQTFKHPNLIKDKLHVKITPVYYGRANVLGYSTLYSPEIKTSVTRNIKVIFICIYFIFSRCIWRQWINRCFINFIVFTYQMFALILPPPPPPPPPPLLSSSRSRLLSCLLSLTLVLCLALSLALCLSLTVSLSISRTLALLSSLSLLSLYMYTHTWSIKTDITTFS